MSGVKKQFDTMSDDELKALAAQNSAAWHSADGAGQTRLHDENVVINQILDQRRGESTAFDPDSGTWGERGPSDVSVGTAVPGGPPQGVQRPEAARSTSGEFSYRSAPEYVDKYQSLVDQLTKDILGRKEFEYDPESDPMYQQYKESYTRNGERAMRDTLGQVSARTGGLASSYAASAAQQTYDGYMAQLADKVPQLRQLAYEMYLSEEDRDRANLEMLMGLEQGDYAKYQGRLGQYNADRSMDFDIYRGQVGDSQWQQSFDRGVLESDRDFAHQVGREQIADQQYADETAYSRGQDALSRGDQDKQNAVNRVYAYLQAGGDVAGLPPELAEQSGLSSVELAALAADFAQQRDQSNQKFAAELAATQAGTAAKYASGIKKPSDNGSGSEEYDRVLKTAKGFKDDTEGLVAYLLRMSDPDTGMISPEEADRMLLVDLGIDPESIPDVAGEVSPGGVPKTYEEFVTAVPGKTPYTRNEFQGRKNSGSSAVAQYEDYEDYLAKMYQKYKEEG